MMGMMGIKKKTVTSLILCTLCVCLVMGITGCSGDKGSSKNDSTAKFEENLPAPVPQENAARDKYDIQLTLDTTAKSIAGSVSIQMTNTSQDTWTQVAFRDYIAAIGSLFNQMNAINSNLQSEFSRIYDTISKEDLTYTRAQADGSVLLVDLKNALEPGNSMKLTFEYQANIPKDAFRYRYAAVNDGENLLFELGNFYPVLCVYENGQWQHEAFYYEGECFYSKCADYTITLSLPKEYTVVASGTESKAEAEDGQAVWTIDAENMRDVGITACDYLAVMESDLLDTDIKCYYFDNETAKQQAQLMLDTAVGIPYCRDDAKGGRGLCDLTQDITG